VIATLRYYWKEAIALFAILAFGAFFYFVARRPADVRHEDDFDTPGEGYAR
jgi:hypothetical protein